jgi:Trk K+ transport system NAD-binding subunit
LRYEGLSNVIADTLSHEGSEIYMQEHEQLIGRTFLDAMLSTRDAVPFGIMTADEECILCPRPDYVIKTGERVIVYAEDDSSYDFEDECIADPTEWSRSVHNTDRFSHGKRH